MEIFERRRGLLSFLKSSRKMESSAYTQCEACDENLLIEEMRQHHYVCPRCGAYNYMPTRDRLDMVLDDDYKIIEDRIKHENPLDFPDYDEIIEKNQDKAGLKEAITTAHGKIGGQEALVMVMDKAFIMGSMGSYVGEKIAETFELAGRKNLPVIIYSASGGARMQEGIVSLMQMAKTSSAVKDHSDKGLLFVNIFTNPTTGGVTASFASLADLAIGEPEALIAFAGPRVIKQTIGEDLPQGFQRSEFQMAKGFLDDIIERKDQKAYLQRVLFLHSR